MRLAADLLDKQLRDRRGRPCGKVDGIVLALGDGAPRVVALEVGAVTLARRLGPRCGRWVERAIRRLAPCVTPTYRIPWRRVRGIGTDVDVDLDADRTRLTRAERWLRDRVIGRIPGG